MRLEGGEASINHQANYISNINSQKTLLNEDRVYK